MKRDSKEDTEHGTKRKMPKVESEIKMGTAD
jgi:hypothetical protein